MNKAVTMTFRVEPDLHARFLAIVELEHRPAAQVLREFMRGYVERNVDGQQIQRAESLPLQASISDTERMQREKAILSATASVGLEGFKLSEADQAHARRFINGEIDMEEFVKVRDAKAC